MPVLFFHHRLTAMCAALLLLVCPTLSAETVSLAALAEAADRRDASAEVWAAALTSPDTEIAQAAARGLGRIGGAVVVPSLLPLLAHSSAEVRAEAAFALGISASDDSAVQQAVEHALLDRLRLEDDPAVRMILLRALGNSGGEASQQALRAYLFKGTVKLPEEQAAWAQATGLLWSYRRASLTAVDSELVDQLIAASTEPGPVAEMAAFAVARARKEPVVQARAKELLKAFGRASHEGARIFLLRALAPTVTSADGKMWLLAQQQSRVSGRALNANERIELHTMLAAQLQAEPLRNAVAATLRSPVSAERYAVLQTLQNRPVELAGLQDLLQAQVKLQPGDQALLMPLLHPPTAEAEAGTEGSEPLSATAPYAEAVMAVGRRFRLHTTRGVIEIVLLPEAVYSAANFAVLADQGFYNRTVFHRVIGNFVAQGGDPTATGEGGPGWRIREELSTLPHAPGYIGMATSGKDTAGSQFFINTGRNPHLDWHYSVFAKVLVGMAVALQLRQGDRLLEVTALP